MTNVTTIVGCNTTRDIEPDQVLEAAVGRLARVVVVGWMENGEIYLSMSSGLRGENLWLLEKGRDYLLEMG